MMLPSALTLETVAPELREPLRTWLPPVGTGAASALGASLLDLQASTGLGLAAVGAVSAMVAVATGHHTLARHLGGAAVGFSLAAAVRATRRETPADPWPVTRGGALILWGTLERRLAALGDVLAQTQPQVVIVHGNEGLTPSWVSRVRALVPQAKFWVEQWVQGPADAMPALERARRALDMLQAETAIWNAERPWKDTGSSGARAAQALLAGWTRATGLPQGFTSYARPTLHRSFPWAAFAGGRDSEGTYDLACDFSLPQVYPFGDEMRSGEAAYPALTDSMQAFRSGWADAVSRGMIRASVQTAPMIPAAHLSTRDYLDALGLAEGSPLQRPPCAAFWPHHGVVSSEGAAALRAFSEAYR